MTRTKNKLDLHPGGGGGGHNKVIKGEAASQSSSPYPLTNIFDL